MLANVISRVDAVFVETVVSSSVVDAGVVESNEVEGCAVLDVAGLTVVGVFVEDIPSVEVKTDVVYAVFSTIVVDISTTGVVVVDCVVVV